MASTRLGYLATKIETTKGTGVTPTHFLRYQGGDIMHNQENIENNPIQNNRRNPLYPIAGKQGASGSFDYDAEAKDCVYWFYGAMGGLASSDISSATDGSVYSHICTVANTIPSWTVEQGKGNLTDTANNRQNYIVSRAIGVMIDKLTLSASDGKVSLKTDIKSYGLYSKRDLIANITAGSTKNLSLENVDGLTTSDSVNIYDETPQNEVDAIAAISTSNKTIQIATLGNSYTVANKAKVSLEPLTASYTAPQFFAFHMGSFQFGTDLSTAASATEENIENWEFSFSNNLEERYGSLKQGPSVIGEKGCKATLKFTRYFENREELDEYLRQTKRACIITISNNTIISATDTNAYKYRIYIELSDMRWTTYEMPTGVDDLYVVNVEGTCYYDSSDARAIRITVRNANVGTTYTA